MIGTNPPDVHPGAGFTLPYDRDAEEQLIGACMYSAAATGEAVQRVTPAHFFIPRNADVWAAITEVHAAGNVPDTVTVGQALQAAGNPSGYAIAAEYSGAGAVPGNIGYYTDVVLDYAARRHVATAMLQGLQGIQTGTDPHTIRETVIEAMYAVTDQSADVRHIGEVLPEAVEWLQRPQEPFLATPWPEVDQIIGGWRPGALYLVLAGSGVGKSILTAHASLTAAQGGQTVLMSSLEMTNRENALRFLANAADINSRHLANAALTRYDWERVDRHLTAVSGLPLYLTDRAGQTVADVRRAALDVKGRAGRLDLLAVDYLQIMGSPAGRRHNTRAEEVGSFSGELKNVAKELGVPVIVPGQVNRDAAKRVSKEPMLEDARESSKSVHDADVVLYLTQDTDRESPRQGEVDLHVLKNRFGERGQVVLSDQKHYGRFASMGAGL